MKKTLLLIILATLVTAGCKQKEQHSPSVDSEETHTIINMTEAEHAESSSIEVDTQEVLSESHPSEKLSNIAPPAHNARDALDWAGTYTGTLPCDDCEGIATTVTLSPNGAFQLSQIYLGKEERHSTEGDFAWNDQGNTITANEFSFFVSENRLIQLDKSGNRMTGDLADYYELRK